MAIRKLILEMRELTEKGLPNGTVHTWADGHDYMKTKDGWVPVPNGYGKKAAKDAAAKAPAKKVWTGKEEPAKKDAEPAKKDAKAEPAPKTEPAKEPAKKAAELAKQEGITSEPTEPPPKGKPELNVKVDEDKDGDGITDAARVGVCGNCVPPPPGIGRLPNLTKEEREVESRFADAFEKDPDGVVKEYVRQLTTGELGADGPNVYATDDAKMLSPDYNIPGVDKKDERNLTAKAVFNVAVHQTANAIVKRAFVQKLDELAKLPEGDKRRQVLVTSGGVAAGKGYAISNVDGVSNVAKEVGAVWDAAGEQNATENPWVLEECKKRGLRPIFVFVDSDPKVTFASEQRGMVERANKKGRVVDARLFADSYAIGSKNFQAFMDQNKNNKEVDFVVLSSRGEKPVKVDKFPEEAAKQDAETIYAEATKELEGKQGVKPAVRRGASVGKRIWGPPGTRQAR